VQIRAETQQLRERLELSPRPSLEKVKLTLLQDEVDRLNALISKHNRMAPVASVQMGLLSVIGCLPIQTKKQGGNENF
jgi:hypothetical protein